jgi:Flp pilus assembly protein TadG
MRCPRTARRAGVLPLAALLLGVILAMAAFAVDVGYTVLVQAQLQKAADAAALAGAAELMQPYVQYNSPGQPAAQKSQILSTAISNAQAKAQQFAGLNKAGSVTSLSLNTADIVCGFLDGQGNFAPTPPDSHFPNSVRVTVRRDDQANGTLRLIFGPLIGTPTVSLTATARATIMSGPTTFNPLSPPGPLLPVALDVRVWDQFMQDGTSPSANNQVLTGPNGQAELQVYPDASQFGHFGLVSIGAPANDVPSYRQWIDSGPSTGDLQYLVQHNLLPVSPQQPAVWYPGPGMKSTLQTDFAQIEGQPRLIPLYDGSQSTSNGYPVIGFAAATVTQATGRGSNMVIAVQPILLQDPTGTGTTPAGSSVTSFIFGPTRLTQ